MKEVKHSACALDCPDMCGLAVTVEDGRVTHVTGDHRGPITDGIVCGKVRKFADLMYGADRVLTPLVRDGARGQFRRASWDEALDLVAARLRATIAEHGSEAVLPYHYGGSNGWLTEGGAATRFFRRLGASRLDRTYCAAATTEAMRGMYGKVPGVALEDYVHAKLIVLWGVNPNATSIHLVPIIDRARAAGAKLVVVDPRETPLAKRADLHVALRPGTDVVAALAIANALVWDRPFLAQHAAEVAQFANVAGRWDLDDAARIAGVERAVLARFVALYEAASPAVIRCGWGVERNRNGGSAVSAILALPAVANKFGVRGGGFTMTMGDADWGIGAEAGIGEPEQTQRRLINMSEIARELRDRRDPPIAALVVYNCNPVATAPDQRLLVDELARDDRFVVVHDQVMTDTARLADVVLPATTFLEHREIQRGYGTLRMYDARPVVAPVGEARSNNQLFSALIARMGLARPGDATTDDAIADAIYASTPRGAERRAELAAKSIARAYPGDNPMLFVDVLPGTPDRKIHLVAYPHLYAYQPDPATAEFPLALISPALAAQLSSQFGQLRDAPAVAELAHADAAARGIADGDAIRMWNALGEVHCLAKVVATVRPGVVVMHKGYWRKHTANGYTSNALIPGALADLGGQAAFNDARVQVEKRRG